jgi:hypothetical protein|tara:strand:- start:561 stop:1523 length:963 start_codon:yes stop_codon:yes gene_type:complete
MSTEDNWDTIEVSDKEEIEFEVEDEAVQNVAEQQEKEPVQLELPEVEQVGATEEEQEDRPQELEGIETKGAEKRIRQLIRQRKERDEQITELANFNRKLQEELTTKKTEVNRISKNSLDMTEKQLNDKVSLARKVYMEAFEEGDKERVLQAQEILNDAQADLKNVSMRKQYYDREEVQQPVEEPVVQQAAPDPRARDWAASNEWFGQDSIMTAAALAIDSELKEQGYDPNDDYFYEEIDKRLQNAFPQKFGESQERVQENTSQPAQVVSGASRSSPSSNKKVKLSKEDVRLANKWGIPLEQYAAEKLKVTQADGEYTVVT